MCQKGFKDDGISPPCAGCDKAGPAVAPENELFFELYDKTPHEPITGSLDFTILWKLMDIYERWGLDDEMKLEIHETAMFVENFTSKNKHKKNKALMKSQKDKKGHK